MEDCPTLETQQRNFIQSASLLATRYGDYLKPNVMGPDPFCTLSGLFQFSASSETQFLNLIESKIDADTRYYSLENEEPTLANLLYFQELLESHLSKLKANLEVIKYRGGPHWVRIAEEWYEQKKDPAMRRTADEVVAHLVVDYEALVKKCEHLLHRCSKGMDVMMYNATILESRRAIMQGEGVMRLTLIASFYIPLSFTTSFFGMNFVELGTETRSIWVWFVTTAPIFAITLAFLLGYISRLGRVQHRLLRRGLHRR